jgi:hypothetical protein
MLRRSASPRADSTSTDAKNAGRRSATGCQLSLHGGNDIRVTSIRFSDIEIDSGGNPRVLKTDY